MFFSPLVIQKFSLNFWSVFYVLQTKPLLYFYEALLIFFLVIFLTKTFSKLLVQLLKKIFRRPFESYQLQCLLYPNNDVQQHNKKWFSFFQRSLLLVFNKKSKGHGFNKRTNTMSSTYFNKKLFSAFRTHLFIGTSCLGIRKVFISRWFVEKKLKSLCSLAPVKECCLLRICYKWFFATGLILPKLSSQITWLEKKYHSVLNQLVILKTFCRFSKLIWI